MKVELLRLQKGNKKEKQRYENALKAVSAVLLDPENRDDYKKGTGQYKAADVLSQYRIFYEVLKQENIVHFVWMNDDKYIHDSSKDPDPCYDRFKTLVQTGKISQYVAPSPPKVSFTLTGVWKKSVKIYAKYMDNYDNCHSDLTAITDDKGVYKISKVTASVENKGLEELLLEELIADAKGKGITIQKELSLKADQVRVNTMRKLLRKLKFSEVLSDDDVELWELKIQ
ncbi:hypothetical protein [Bdellovibrio sp. BCCA]|uniref:hypothetical protein n=1 Tax=Bdellovibrio sp. BCCA TaxID=3136281 RepID=UPI0030F13CED